MRESNREAGAVRLEDIAARIGVSRSEVSRVINGRIREGKGVGAAMRQRILDVAQEMNYRPHRAAQNLARGRTDTVALMMVLQEQLEPIAEGDAGETATVPLLAAAERHDLSPHYHEIIGALTYTLQQYGINLLLTPCGGGDTPPEEAMTQIARSRLCDGMIITDMRVDDPRPALLEETGLTYVVRGSCSHPGVVAVGVDNFQVGFQAVTYLAGLGHRRIAFFNIGRDLMSGLGRYRGMCAAKDSLQPLGVEVEYRDDVHTEEEACNAVRQRLREPQFPTAIFAENEIGALGAMRALAEASLRVPDDVSVMTALNARFMQQVAPHLTVLNLHQARVAAEAGHLLARRLRGDSVEPGQRLIAPALEERGTTAPPPKIISR